MSLPWELNPPKGAVSPGVVVELDIPSRARINKVQVSRTDSIGSGSFTVDLYSNATAASYALSNSNTRPTDAHGNNLNPSVFKIMPSLTGANGEAAYYMGSGNTGPGFCFFNQDAVPAAEIKINQRKAYLLITASGGVYCVNIGVDSDMHT